MLPKNFIESYIYSNEAWEPHILDLISAYLHTNQTVIDIGANIGATSIPLAKNFPNSMFYLFEPHPIVYKKLVDNISYNLLKNVQVENIAITDKTDTCMPFYAQKNASNFGLSSFKLNPDIEEFDIIDVKCKSLDSIFFNTDIEPSIIKIDTQGSELEVLLSASKIIAKYRPVIFFEFESEYFESIEEEDITKNKILEFFASLNYELYMISTNNKFLPKISFKGYFNGDIIAVPASSS